MQLKFSVFSISVNNMRQSGVQNCFLPSSKRLRRVKSWFKPDGVSILTRYSTVVYMFLPLSWKRFVILFRKKYDEMVLFYQWAEMFIWVQQLLNTAKDSSLTNHFANSKSLTNVKVPVEKSFRLLCPVLGEGKWHHCNKPQVFLFRQQVSSFLSPNKQLGVLN